MHSIEIALKERSQITNLTLLDDDKIFYATKYNGARIIDTQEYKTHLKLIHKELGADTTAICINKDATLLAFANKNVINILNLKTKKIIKSIRIANQYINKLSFSLPYIIAGTNQGRVLQYRYDNSALLARICSFPYKRERIASNFISAFSLFNTTLAASGQGGALIISDIYIQDNNQVLIEQGERINALCFIDQQTIVSANISGKIIVHSLTTEKIINIIDAPFSDIKQIIKMPNPHFIAIIGDENYIAIADIHKGKIVHTKYIEFTYNIDRVLLVNDASLLVALRDYSIINVKLPTLHELKELIMQGNLEDAYAMVENEKMLQESREYKILEQRYKLIYNNALNALINQSKTLAQKIILPIKKIDSKKREISALFTAFENYNRFKILYLEKKYALAFAMAKKHEALQKTPIYIKLEDAWKDAFVNAQRHIALEKDEHAKALLNEYITVTSKRPIIKLFLNKDKNFMAFLQAIQRDDFQTIEELLHNNPLLKEVPTYVVLHQSIEKNIAQIDLLINKGDLIKAKELLSKFKRSSFLKEELKRVYSDFENMTHLQNAYKDNDFKLCYEILDKHPALNSSELGILLNKHWTKLIEQCEEFALKANPNGIKTTLNDLLLVQTRKGKVGDLLRVSFHSRVKAFLAKKNFGSAKNIIYSYIDIFGNDNEIKSLMRTYEAISKQHLAITQDDRVDRNRWSEIEDIIA